MRGSPAAAFLAAAFAVCTPACAQPFVIHPRVFNDVPGSTFTSSVSASSVGLSDQTVVAPSGYANRHDWRLSTDGISDATIGPSGYFDLSVDLVLTGSPVSPRKEAGLRLDGPCGSSQLMVNTDSHEVVAFGGAFPYYDFRAHGAADYVSGQSIHLRIRYLQQAGVSGFLLTAGGVTSPFLPAAATVCAGTTVGGYLQVCRSATAPNGGSASFTNITYASGPGPPAITDEALLDRTEAQACFYAHENLVTTAATEQFPNGRAMVRDSSNSGSVCSVAATGFGLVCLAIEAQRYGSTSEWTVTPADARAKTNAILDTVLELQAGTEQWSGLPYHWVHPGSSGAFVRDGTSEVSTVDGAYLVLGALTAGQAFGGEVRLKALQIAANVHWNPFLITTDGVPRISMAWRPEYDSSGYSIPAGAGYLTTGNWDRLTDEILGIAILATGSDPRNVSLRRAFYDWPRTRRSYVGGNGVTYSLVPSYFGSMFTYTQLHGLLPLDTMGRDHPEDAGASAVTAVDWWSNAVMAAQASRQFSADHAPGQTPADGYAIHASFGADSWGLTAAVNPSSPYDYKGLLGAPPREANGGAPEAEGIIAPYGAISAMPLMRTGPSEALAANGAFAALRHYYDTQFYTLWGAYGPKEAFDDTGAVANVWLGIDAPLEGINIEAYRSGATGAWTASSPPVADGLAVLFHKGLAPGDMDLDGSVTTADAIAILRIAGGLASPTPAQRYNGDPDGDGRITLQDVVATVRAAV